MWDRERRVLVKAEHLFQGSNPRFVVTNLDGDTQTLYEKIYCGGERWKTGSKSSK